MIKLLRRLFRKWPRGCMIKGHFQWPDARSVIVRLRYTQDIRKMQK
jgi:hypothetical protein